MKNKTNAFIIGVQKAGTTSLYDWLIQHNDIDGHFGIKDLPIFVDDKSTFTEDWLDSQYSKKSKIRLHGSVQYFYYPEKFVENVKNYISNGAKFILVLRNPFERAVSGYSYAIKSNLISTKTSPLRFSLEKEEEIMGSDSYDFLDKGRLTPILHSLYAKNLEFIVEHIPPENLKIVIYETFFPRKEEQIAEIYSFLGVDDGFTPKFKHLNIGGKQKYKNIKLLWKNRLVQSLLQPLVPYKIRRKAVKNLIELNTIPEKLILSKQEEAYLR